MGDTYLYLSVIPEALVASMLPPREFGTYLAIGSRKRSRGPAIFFDLQNDFETDYFDMSVISQKCVPHPDGTPKRSLYLGVYRVLEHVPLKALNSLWLTTRDGKVLELTQDGLPGSLPGTHHLYQEICPVHPMVASSLAPAEFCRFITDPQQAVSVPKIFFVDMWLADLADDPANGEGKNLPYPHMDHLRDCLMAVTPEADKHTKTVDRIPSESFPYRCIKSGFYVGNQEEVLYYPFLTHDELQNKYYSWWRSATAQ